MHSRSPITWPVLTFLALWCTFAGPASLRADQAYNVRPGDSLFAIAKKHGVTVDALVRRNGIDKARPLRPGQRLVIPDKSGSKPAAARVAEPRLPDYVERAIREAKVKPGRWKYIVIHHSGVDTGTMGGMDRYHREVRHMENGLAYHFVIGNGSGIADGTIGVGHRWTKQLDGGHLISDEQNRVALGICLVGNFEKTRPTARQLERLDALLEALMRRCHLDASAIRTHKQINIVHTRCPGRYFPIDTVLKRLPGKIVTGSDGPSDPPSTKSRKGRGRSG